MGKPGKGANLALFCAGWLAPFGQKSARLAFPATFSCYFFWWSKEVN